jgi:hypothetical protein
MSTYLVAFVIGSYDYVEIHDKNNVLIRVYTPIGKKEQGWFALKVSDDRRPKTGDDMHMSVHRLYPINSFIVDRTLVERLSFNETMKSNMFHTYSSMFKSIHSFVEFV